jgi:ribosomal protein RSM22 (predicted rRNA methylase)
MQLPLALKDALEREASRIKPADLARASRELSQNYREGNPSIASDVQRIAYAVVRMPATYAAVHTVLTEIRERMIGVTINSLLDLGAGPGTVMWAAGEVFEGLRDITLVERDKNLITLGQRLASRPVAWHALGVGKASPFKEHDLVVLSYALNEMNSSVLRTAWEATREALVVIEPGTPAGFSRIRSARSELIAAGGHLLAPCPHEQDCPMQDPDWCHFAKRIERSSQHRRAKGGTMGYEDEKYSYVAVSRRPSEFSDDRILRHPYKGPGYVQLDLCTLEGLRKVTVTRSDKEAYRLARKAEWGHAFRSTILAPAAAESITGAIGKIRLGTPDADHKTR